MGLAAAPQPDQEDGGEGQRDHQHAILGHPVGGLVGIAGLDQADADGAVIELGEVELVVEPEGGIGARQRRDRPARGKAVGPDGPLGRQEAADEVGMRPGRFHGDGAVAADRQDGEPAEAIERQVDSHRVGGRRAVAEAGVGADREQGALGRARQQGKRLAVERGVERADAAGVADAQHQA